MSIYTDWDCKSYNDGQNPEYVTVKGPVAGTLISRALNGGYTYGSTGPAYYHAFVPSNGGVLSEMWVKPESHVGDWNLTDKVINYEIRVGFTASRQPSTTKIKDGVINLDGSTNWQKMSGLTGPGLSAGAMYVLVFYDADGSTANHVVMGVRMGTTVNTVSTINSEVATTSNGFSTAATQSAGSFYASYKVGDDIITGNILTSAATVTNNTTERGCRFMVPEECALVGVSVSQDTATLYTNGNIFKLYPDSATAGGTPIVTKTVIGNTGNVGVAAMTLNLFFSELEQAALRKNTWYRLVLDPVAAITTPRKCTSTATLPAELISRSFPLKGNIMYTQESALTAGVWVDETNAMSSMGPIIAPLKTIRTRMGVAG